MTPLRNRIPWIIVIAINTRNIIIFKPISPIPISNPACLRPRKVVRTLLKHPMWHQWFNHNVKKLREYFVCKENKNNNFIQQFLLFCVSLRCAFTRVPRHMRVHSSACNEVQHIYVSTSECRLLCSSITRMHRGTLVNMRRRHGREETVE